MSANKYLKFFILFLWWITQTLQLILGLPTSVSGIGAQIDFSAPNAWFPVKRAQNQMQSLSDYYVLPRQLRDVVRDEGGGVVEGGGFFWGEVDFYDVGNTIAV